MDLRGLGESARAQYKPRLIEFYSPFFPSKGDAEQLIDLCHRRMDSDPRPARILHNVERLIGLSDSILTLDRGRDTHLVVFSIICVEAIHQLAYPDSTLKKVDIIKEFFEQWVTPDDRAYLQKHVTRSAADERWEGEMSTALPLETIARIFNAVRNDFVHEGVGWGFHFCSDDYVPILNVIEVAENAQDFPGERTYEVSLTRKDFRGIIIRGAIQLIRSML